MISYYCTSAFHNLQGPIALFSKGKNYFLHLSLLKLEASSNLHLWQELSPTAMENWQPNVTCPL